MMSDGRDLFLHFLLIHRVHDLHRVQDGTILSMCIASSSVQITWNLNPNPDLLIYKGALTKGLPLRIIKYLISLAL